MKKLLLLNITLLLSCIAGYSQDSIRISGHLLNNTKYAKVIVKKFDIGSFDIAAFPIKNEKFSIVAPASISPGVYRLQYSQSEQNGYIDVIIDGKEKVIDFTIDINNIATPPVFNASEENKKWYAYQQESQKRIQKISFLGQFITQYPEPKDTIVTQVTKAYQIKKNELQKNELQFLSQNQNTWAAHMVENKPLYFANPTEDLIIQEYNQKNNFWNGINTNNPQLINTPLYTDHILNYLKYYMNPEMHFSETEMEEGFKKSVDTIMRKFSGNDVTKKFALKYLQLGFKEIGNEKVLQYIDEKYKGILLQCQDDTDNADFENRLKAYEALKPGVLAPEIQLVDGKGKLKTLIDFKQKEIVVVFWASWCPHCLEEVPKLQDWAKNNPDTLVLAISLDTDYNAFQEAIKQFPNLLHYCDLQKWEGKITSDYYVVATPTFFVLDKDRKIRGKYSSVTNLIAVQNDK